MNADLCLDTGALIAIERHDVRARGIIRQALDDGVAIHIPAAVVAQAWRTGDGRQAPLARFLGERHHQEVPLDSAHARAAGRLCAMSGTTDIVDAHVVLLANLHDAIVVTSDPEDIHRIDPTVEVFVV